MVFFLIGNHSVLVDENLELGVEISLFVHRIVDQISKLNSLLQQYGVKSPNEIEEMIYEGKLPGHPTYEDYLSALAYQQNARAFFDQLSQKIEVLSPRVK